MNDKTNKKRQEKAEKEKEALTNEGFFKSLFKSILTIKKPKSPDEGKKKTPG